MEPEKPSGPGGDRARDAYGVVVALAGEAATYSLDPTGHVVSWSEGAERLKGYRAHEIIGQPFDVFYTPEDAAAGRPAHVLAETAKRGHYDEDGWRVRKDGSRFWAHAVVAPVRDDAGQLLGYTRTTRDMTAEKRMEDARRITDAVYSAMDAIITLDESQNVVLFNPAAEKMFQQSADEVLGRPVDRLIPARFREAHHQHVRRFGESKVTHRSMGSLGMVLGLRANGEEFPIEASISTTRSDRGHSYTVIMRDITERVRTEAELRAAKSELEAATEALREANRRKDDFLAMLAHELRNPLTPIVNATQLLGRRAAEDASSARLLGIISRQTSRMAKLIDDLLDTSRIVRGRVALERSIVDLRACLDSAIESTKPLLQARQHALDVALPDEPLAVDADPLRMEQVFVNLLNNAAKYTDPGGRIAVKATRSAGTVVVRVSDTGRGIATELLPHIFELFTQGTQAMDRRNGGLGIGLTIARNLVEMHGGSIEARSEGPGKGSEFVVRLPLAATLPESAAREPAQSADEAVASCRVLVVEDNLEAAETLRDLLRGWGHEVSLAADGPSAIERAHEFKPDLIFLDLGLPGIDGYEVARRLRAEPEGRATRIVAVTGYGQEQDRIRSKAAGIDEHLVKPVPSPKLRDAAARACRAGEAREVVRR